ncbi:hypothetical protein SVIOM342S_10629 [Streptomyces violaceorubidus]
MFVGQVEVAEDLALHADGDAEEAAHRRVVVGKAARARVLGQVGQPDRLRITDERAEQALAAVRQVADAPGGRLVDAVVYEVGEALAVLVHDADGRVGPGVRQIGGRLADAGYSVAGVSPESG